MWIHLSMLNRKKEIWILDKDLTQGLDDTTLTAVKEYYINFSEENITFLYKFVL